MSYAEVIMDQREPITQSTYEEELYPQKYAHIGLGHFRAYKEVFAKIRSGKITKANEDEVIAILADSRAETQRTIDELLFDPLLKKQGFYNGQHFYSHLQEAINILNNNPVPRRENEIFHGEALLRFDLDFFKRANDTHGHPWGDKVLQHVAGIISKHVKRRQDFVGRPTNEEGVASPVKSEESKTGRPGGEELDALLYDVDINGAVTVADNIRRELETTSIKTPDGKDWHQTISIGICALKPGITLEEVINNVDTALYNSKENGRNRVTVWKEGMTMPEPQPTATR